VAPLTGLLGPAGLASQPWRCRRRAELLCVSREQCRKFLPDDFAGPIFIEALGTGIPLRDPAVGLQQGESTT